MSNPIHDLSSLHLSRRGVLGMGAALGVGAAVSACGGGSSGGPAGQAADIAEGAYEGEKVTLKFWNGFTGGDGDFMKQMVEKFNAEHDPYLTNTQEHPDRVRPRPLDASLTDGTLRFTLPPVSWAAVSLTAQPRP